MFDWRRTPILNAQSQTLADDAVGELIEEALVIVVGDGAERSDFESVFADKYRYTVLRGDTLSEIKVPDAVAAVDRFDAVIVVLEGAECTLRGVERLFVDSLQIENMEEMVKMVVSVGSESVMDRGNEEEMKQPLNELFGIIESNDVRFGQCFVDLLRGNGSNFSILSLVQRLRKSVRGVTLHRFDPQLFLYQLAENGDNDDDDE